MPLLRRVFSLSFLVLLATCKEPTQPPKPQATKLGVLAQPTDVVAGVSIAPGLQIAVQDASGSLMSATTNVTIAITSGSGTPGAVLLGTLTRAAVDGIATFGDIHIERAGTAYTLTATAASLTNATTNAFNVAAAAPARLQVTTQPGNATAGAAIAPAVQLSVQDAFGNAVTTATHSIALAITAGTGGAGATLGGTPSKAAVAGTASFTDLTINKAASGYTLTASSQGLQSATTGAFAVTAGAPAKLAIMSQPSNATAAMTMTPAVDVSVQDALGNTVQTATNGIALAITAGSGAAGATLAGTTTLNAAAGAATFSNLSIDKAGTGYTLTASTSGLSSATTGAFAVAVGLPARLGFAAQPGDVTAGASINPSVQVVVQDAGGNTMTNASTSVSIAIASGTGASGATLGGTVTKSAVSGVATFSDLSIAKAATGYALAATAASLTSGTSNQFAVNPGAPALLAFTVQPSGVVAGSVFSPALQVAVHDALGNLVTSSSANITIAITSGTGDGGATLTGIFKKNAVSGVATFSDLEIDKAAADYTLTATSPGVGNGTSVAFTVVPGAAASLAYSTQPTTVTSLSAMTPAVALVVTDAEGNVVTNAATNVTLAITSGTGTAGAILSGTLTRATSSGVVTFNDLGIDKAGSGFTLTATGTSLTAAVSSAFSVNPGAPIKLGFSVQPAVTPQGVTLAPAIKVSVQDAAGNTVSTSAANIAVGITTGTGASGAVLGGDLDVGTVSGTATFSDLTIDKPGTGYTLTATAASLANGVSSQFTIQGGTISGTITPVSQLLSASSMRRDAVAVSKVPRTGTPQILSSSPIAAGAKAQKQLIVGEPTRSAEQRGRQQPSFVADELIVTFRGMPGAPLQSVRGMTVGSLRNLNVAIRAKARELALPHAAQVTGAAPAIRSVRLRVDPSRIESVKTALERDPNVAKVERNAIVFTTETSPRTAMRMAPRQNPSDPSFVFQTWHYLAVDLDYAWGITTGSTSVIVAVIDDGIRFDHPDIAANLTNDGYDFVSSTPSTLCGGGSVDLAGDGDGPDNNPTIPNNYTFNQALSCFSQNFGTSGHGLHVAGLIGALANNGQGGSGINWNVRIRPVRVMNSGGQGTNFDIAQGILYAAGLPVDIGSGTIVQAPSPARIINISIGSSTNTAVLQDAVTAAANNGALLIAAAGNTPSSVPNYPAAYPEVISVSAVGPDLNLASYSSFGSTIDIAAPGGDDLDGGSSYRVYSTRWNFGANTATYGTIQGTSMAAPHVSGAAALILAQNPSLTAAQVRARLESFAVDLGPAGPDDSYGAGLLNARNALTQSMSFASVTRARLFNANTGAFVADATVAGNGSYSFAQIGTGTYWVFGGQDEDLDSVFGPPPRRWSAFGGTSTPTPLTVAGTATHTASFNLGFAFEHESNNTSATADVIVLGAHRLGFASETDEDWAVVRVPSDGQYTFETQPFRGSCGFAEELDTVLDLYSSTGTLIDSSDDIDFGARNWCSRITATLSAGTYFLRTTGYSAPARRYYLVARSG